VAETVKDTKRCQHKSNQLSLQMLSQRVGESGVTPFAARLRISSKLDYGEEGSAHGQAEETRFGQIHPE
jgi:hypothetical protein